MNQDNPEENKVLTQVTTLAEEEEKSGKKINVPNPEQLVGLASSSLLRCRKQISMLLPSMSKKAINRAILAVLDMPTDGIPVELKTKEEKLMFALGQRAISDRFIIVQHSITQQLKKKKEEGEAKEKQKIETAESKEETNNKESEKNDKEK